ncbi:MAG: M15 family metallopeptidase [Clostridia bacterium]|nr:M15 family metallopeptidase [Clostridia bacterium]
MTKNNGGDAYKKLVRVLLVLFVLVIICGAGYMLMDRSIQAQQEENQKYAAQENQLQQEQYQQALAEWQKQEVKAEAPSWPAPKAEGWDVVDLSGFPVNSAYDVNASRKDLLLGGMVLVNKWHALPDDFYAAAEEGMLALYQVNKEIPVSGSGVRLMPDAITALGNMLTDAKAEGLENFLIEEGYRSLEKQQQYYTEAESNYTSRYSGEALKQKTIASGVNYPGTSEYQSAFAFNPRRYLAGDSEFNSPKFFETPHSDWLVENSWEYGFVFRFPVEGYPNKTMVDKSYKTGVTSKLMIYRYVGEGHAAAMHVLGMCMEEYVEYLMAHPHIAVYENGTLKYEITRKNANTQNGASVEVSGNAREYGVSMDNCGGVIVCMSY